MNEREHLIRRMLGKQVHVEVDRPLGYVHGDILYPINYGFIPGLMAGDGEEQDAYILGVSEPISSFDGQVIGAVCRKNDCEDKLVVAPEGMLFHQGQIAEAVRFQEQYFDTSIRSLYHKSCGVLPYRDRDGVREYLIVFEQFSKCWSLPKGHMEAGEREEMTALRELQEETGLTARLNTSISASIRYPIGPNAHKLVVFFPGKVCGTPRPRDGEIDAFRWVREEELSNYLFPDTVDACKQLIQKMTSK